VPAAIKEQESIRPNEHKELGHFPDVSYQQKRTYALVSYGFIHLLILFLFTFGCAVNQDKEIASYRDVLGKPPEGVPEKLEPNQPLALVTALEMANWHNEQLAIKGEQYLQSLIDKDRAASNFLPQIAYVPTYTRQEKISFSGLLGSLGSQFVPPHTFDQPVNAQLNLNVPGDIANVERAGSAAQRQKSLLLDLKSTILLDVARVYYQVMLYEAQVRVLENSVSVQNDRVTNVRNKYRAGTARELDVVQAQAQLSQTKVSLIKAKNNASTGRATLAFLINTPVVGGVLSDELQLPSHLPSNDQLLSTAWENREDLKAAAHQVEVSVHSLQEAWSRYFPSISLNFTYWLSRQSFPSEVSWLYSLGLNVPVFSAGLIHEDVRTAWSMLRQTKLYESYLYRQINEELTVAIENYNVTANELSELQVLVKAAQDELQRSIYAYNAGLATNLDTIIARNQLLTAELSLTETKFNEKINFLNLMRILGSFDSESLKSGFEEQLKSTAARDTSTREVTTLHAESEK
jgi:outer membrane protein TolC